MYYIRENDGWQGFDNIWWARREAEKLLHNHGASYPWGVHIYTSPSAIKVVGTVKLEKIYPYPRRVMVYETSKSMRTLTDGELGSHVRKSKGQYYIVGGMKPL